MVQYIGIQDVIEVLRTLGTERVLQELAKYIEDDFRRWEDFDKVARIASGSPNGVIELMPISDGRQFAFKYVNGHPCNTNAGKLTVTAFGVLADVASGYPLLLSEMTLTTALRTAATSALAARYLARPDSRTMALIGAGAQAEFQVLAFKTMTGIEKVRVFDVDPSASARFARNLATVPGIHVHVTQSVDEGLQDADIITTATAAKKHAVVLTRSQVRPGTHINAIGGDCPGKTELDREILHASRVVVEYPPQSRVEGEIQQVDPGFPVVELWRIIAGLEVGRRAVDEVTLFDSVGFALEDFSTLRFLRDITQEIGAVRTIDLVPDVADPRDLYSLLRRDGVLAA
jgi:ornithine cyclodeaminase